MVDILSCDILEEMEDGKRSRGVWHIINNHNRAASDAALQIRRYLFMFFVVSMENTDWIFSHYSASVDVVDARYCKLCVVQFYSLWEVSVFLNRCSFLLQ